MSTRTTGISPVRLLPPETPSPEHGSMLRGILAGIMAVAIALLTLFHRSIPLSGVFYRAERGIPLLDAWQSGHPGDYVLWLAVGATALGVSFVALLR